MKYLSIFSLRKSFFKFTLTTVATLVLPFSLANTASAMVLPGELVISEVMANPQAVGDTAGEWFEVYNRSKRDIDLNGLLVTDNGSNSYTVNSADALIVGSGSYFVFGRNNDEAVNGGTPVDYRYNNFTLGNSSDAINLLFDGLIIDSLEYSSGSSFGIAGQSSELTAGGFALTPAINIYGDGDIGTPGIAGSYMIPAVSEVPLPAASWLFASALGMLKLRRFKA